MAEEELKTFYKTNYIYPTLEQNKRDNDDEKPLKYSGTTSLPFLKRISINSSGTLYSSPINSLGILTTNHNIFQHITTSLNQKMIDIYQKKIDDTLKWRKEYNKYKKKIKVSPSRRLSTDDRLTKQSTILSSKAKGVHLTRLTQ